MDARKYGRTYHFPFSSGTTSDDKILQDWQQLLQSELILTEKLDGENTCFKESGVYARSHVAPTRNPWAQNAWEIWSRIHHELGTLEIFGENLYGLHSIEYTNLESYFYVFAVRDEHRWLSWEEVVFYANLLNLPTVPVINQGFFTEDALRSIIDKQMKTGSHLGGECEGLVVRNAENFFEDDFSINVLKYVRANHVKTDEHWTRNWKRAPFGFERLDASGNTKPR